jgi:hypothetical protein
VSEHTKYCLQAKKKEKFLSHSVPEFHISAFIPLLLVALWHNFRQWNIGLFPTVWPVSSRKISESCDGERSFCYCYYVTLRFEVLTAVKILMLVIWAVTQCTLVGRYNVSGGTWISRFACFSVYVWNLEAVCSSERLVHLRAKPHGATAQKTNNGTMLLTSLRQFTIFEKKKYLTYFDLLSWHW